MELARTTEQLPEEGPRTWRDEMSRQGRTLTWLAARTGKSARSVYGYSRGVYRPSDDWLAEVSGLLGVPVVHVPQLEVSK